MPLILLNDVRKPEPVPQIDVAENYWLALAGQQARDGEFEVALETLKTAEGFGVTTGSVVAQRVEVLELQTKRLTVGVQESPEEGQDQISSTNPISLDKVSIFEEDLDRISQDAKDWEQKAFLACFVMGDIAASISCYDEALKIEPTFYRAWANRGAILEQAGHYEEAIANYDSAINIEPRDYRFWHGRGTCLSYLHRDEEAIASYDKVVKLNPDEHEAWFKRGTSLGNLGRNEEAIISYNRTIKIKPDYHEAWNNRGVSLANLGRDEEAIASYDKAIEIKPDFHGAWSNRGASLEKLGRYEESIASCDRAIEIKPDVHEPWSNRGMSLSKLGRNEEAIASYDQAIEFKPDYHISWANRGITAKSLAMCRSSSLPQPSNSFLASKFNNPALNDRGYLGQLASLTEGRRHCPSPIGQGFLYRALGDAHWDQSKTALYNQANPAAARDAWRAARSAYDQALSHLEALANSNDPACTDQYLKALKGQLRVLLALRDLPAARALQTKGITRLDQLRQALPAQQFTAQYGPHYNAISRLEIDLLIDEDQPSRALTQAELYKNRTLTWILDDWNQTPISPSYPQLRELLTSGLTPTTAILYWHLSQDALTTFILTPDHPDPIVLDIDRRRQAHRLTNPTTGLLTDYKRDYASYTALPKNDPDRHLHPWRQTLADRLTTLRDILAIDQILPHITNAQHLILLPHRDLHLLPLQSYFDRPSTILPSLQIGLNLPSHPTATDQPDLLIEDPDLLYSTIESAILRTLLANHPTPRTLTYLPGDRASHPQTLSALQQPHRLFHFSGHGSHDPRTPENSAIGLHDQPLTAKTIASLDLSAYDLISLAACETSLSAQEIDIEYIGLASAFLKAKARTVLGTIWPVDEFSSLWFILRFYRAYLAGQPPSQALASAQIWLQTQTYSQLLTELQALQQLPELGRYSGRKELATQEQLWVDNMGKIGPEERPYADPFHWAGFTLAGLTADSTHERI